MNDTKIQKMNDTEIQFYDQVLIRIGKIKDGILTISVILYVLGYIVWSINASLCHLGNLPAVQSQYFAAGVVPFVVAVLFLLINSEVTFPP